MSSSDPALVPAQRRPWVLAATATAAFGATVMATAVNVVLPTLTVDLSAPFATIQWVVLAYLLATIALVPIIGRLGDLWGKARLFLAGHTAFGLGSLLCALAPDAATLIAFRTVQGAGAAALTALGLAIVTDVYPAERRGRALGLNAAVVSAGVVLGPSLGGLVADATSWRWIFAGGVLTSALGAALALRVLPRYPRVRGERFDLLGAATLFAGLLALSLALTLGQARGAGDPVILALGGVAVALAVAFFAVERRAASPVVDLRLFLNPEFTVGLVSGSITFIAISGVIFLVPFYLGGALGYTPSRIGLLMAVTPTMLVLMAPIAGSLTDRFGARPVTVVGMALLMVGYLALGTLDEHTTPLGYVLRFLPIGMGMGTFQTPNNTAIMGAARRGASGVAGGLLTLTRFFGQVVGTAVLGSLWATRTVAQAGAPRGSDAMSLPATAQVAGLHDVIDVIRLLIAVALALVIVDMVRGRRAADPLAGRPRPGGAVASGGPVR